MFMMKLTYSKIVTVLLFLSVFSHLLAETEGNEDNLKRESIADSLVSAEKHSEAIEIYRSLLSDRRFPTAEEHRLRLEYKTGSSLMHSGRDAEAMVWFRRVIAGDKGSAENCLINDAMTGLGQTLEYTGKHDSAFYWYMEAYKLGKESNDTIRMARDVRNMAQLLRVLKQYDKARFYCRKAAALIPGINDYKVVANIYNETAYLFELDNEMDSAATYYKELINISVENEYRKGESVGYSNLASVYLKQLRYDEALEFEQKSLEINRKLGDSYGLMNSYRGLSSVYFLSGSYVKALEMLSLAHELCDTSLLPDLSGIKRAYYEIYKKTGQHKKALEYFEAYSGLQDRINQAESRKQVAELLARYEAENKEQKILLLENANMLNANKIRMQRIVITSLGIIGLLILLISWLLFRNNKQKIRQMNIELQHFIIRQEQLDGSAEDELLTEAGDVYRKWGLTSRESEVLYYLGKGFSNSIIGNKLFISENTVKFHIKNIYLKLDINNRIQALLWCKNTNTQEG